MNYSASKLDMLADGIFAIVMTILVFDIKVPTLVFETSPYAYRALAENYPAFLSYLLSFATLFTYWRGYHATVSDFARNADMRFQNLAGMFLFFVALVPFSSHFLAKYSALPAAVVVFSLNVALIGVILYFMRVYAWKSDEIDNRPITVAENNHAFVRILTPVFFAGLAIWVAHLNTTVALSILTVAIIFNLIRRSSHLVTRVVMDKKAESRRKISNVRTKPKPRKRTKKENKSS